VGDQSSSWGTPFSQSNVLPSNQKQEITEVESLSNVTSIISNPVVKHNLRLEGILKSVLLETSQVLGVHCFHQAMPCSQNRMRQLLQVNQAPIQLQLFKN